jgi:hypothetical protein
MSTHSASGTGVSTDRNRFDGHSVRRGTTETKPSFKTTELIFYLLTVAGVLIASAMVDVNEDGQGFGASQAWLYVTLLTIGYMIARGLAKAGSYERDDDPRTGSDGHR